MMIDVDLLITCGAVIQESTLMVRSFLMKGPPVVFYTSW
jgi:hypothetical protein